MTWCWASCSPSTFTGGAHELDGRPFRSQRFLLAAQIVGGELGTTEVDGTTDFARWVPLAAFPLPEPVADIVELALGVLRRRTSG